MCAMSPSRSKSGSGSRKEEKTQLTAKNWRHPWNLVQSRSSRRDYQDFLGLRIHGKLPCIKSCCRICHRRRLYRRSLVVQVPFGNQFPVKIEVRISTGIAVNGWRKERRMSKIHLQRIGITRGWDSSWPLRVPRLREWRVKKGERRWQPWVRARRLTRKLIFLRNRNHWQRKKWCLEL